MPRGVYDRKKSKGTTAMNAAADLKSLPNSHTEVAAKETGKKRRGRKAKKVSAGIRAVAQAPNGKARFGIFDDGSVQIDLPGCKGTMTREEAGVLLGFIQHVNAPR